MSTTPKKQVSKFFRIGVEGATSDGRVIDRELLEQMAKSFDPNVYGARINIEHIRGMSPNSDFKAMGDVIALKTEEIDIGGKKKLALLAQISPTDELIALTKKRQKIYTSMEIRPKFADTDKAYLSGLAVTDSPASLGTEILEFAAKATVNPFAARKDHPDDLFSAAEEAVIEFMDAPEDTASLAAKFADKLKAITAKFSGKSQATDANLEAIVDAIGDIGEAFNTQAEEVTALRSTVAGQAKTIETLSKQVKDLTDKYTALDNTPTGTPRPPANGGAGDIKTDC
ncbi:MAG: hypothetical protein GAK30_01592 [Paracidovorax wautersii]|uniref:Phage capsid scaffolding protein (GPO) serine peptidase n=1 Tax=Paracidovorax wautersii TaxID=1177982 RepID=A0A7V8FPR8_9BURK|nr:MAG: hypothetical protein GAK30_01592 [Paracidovorax wautersii]